MKKERTFSVEIYQSNRHGHYGAEYKGIAVWTITATSKKEAREAALDSMIGLKASDYDFPIDFPHAPEARRTEDGAWSMTYKEAQEHIINEWDIAQKNIFAIDVTEI